MANTSHASRPRFSNAMSRSRTRVWGSEQQVVTVLGDEKANGKRPTFGESCEQPKWGPSEVDGGCSPHSLVKVKANAAISGPVLVSMSASAGQGFEMRGLVRGWTC